MVLLKNRYIIASISGRTGHVRNLTTKDVAMMLKRSVEVNFGEFGCAQTSRTMKVFSYDQASAVFVVRASVNIYHMVRLCLTLLTGSTGVRISVNVEAVTGCRRSFRAAMMKAHAVGYARAGLSEKTASLLLKQKELDPEDEMNR